MIESGNPLGDPIPKDLRDLVESLVARYATAGADEQIATLNLVLRLSLTRDTRDLVIPPSKRKQRRKRVG